MAPKIDDRWIWLGFGIFFFIAARGIRYAIQDILVLTQEEPVPDTDRPKRKKREEQPEDSISTERLGTLAEHPNTNISRAAISILLARCRDDPETYSEMIRDHDEGDERMQHLAKLTVNMINSWKLPQELHRPRRSNFSIDEDDDEWSLPRPSEAPDLAWNELHRRLTEADGEVDDDSEIVEPSPLHPIAGWTSIPHERHFTRDSAIATGEAAEVEMERRRRRREAMVFHEGAGAVEEEDIIRPRPYP